MDGPVQLIQHESQSTHHGHSKWVRRCGAPLIQPIFSGAHLLRGSSKSVMSGCVTAPTRASKSLISKRLMTADLHRAPRADAADLMRVTGPGDSCRGARGRLVGRTYERCGHYG